MFLLQIIIRDCDVRDEHGHGEGTNSGSRTSFMELFVGDWWKENFRISRRAFEDIVRIAGPHMAKKDTTLRQSIPVHKQVVVASWRLATVDTYRSAGLQIGIGKCTAMLIKQDFCQAIARRAPEFIKFPQTEKGVQKSIRFYKHVSISLNSGRNRRLSYCFENSACR